jgi:hypothetical protein
VIRATDNVMSLAVASADTVDAYRFVMQRVKRIENDDGIDFV